MILDNFIYLTYVLSILSILYAVYCGIAKFKQGKFPYSEALLVFWIVTSGYFCEMFILSNL